MAIVEPTSHVRHHLEAMKIGSEVTRWYRKGWEPNVIEVTPEAVLKSLYRAGIKPVLMGTHGINGYRSEPRATQDVDVLVTKKDVRKAINVLETEFPYLEVEENSAVARFVNPVSQKVVLDVMKPNSHAMQVVFRHTIAVGRTHRIPDLEMSVISKFLAMTAPNRRQAKRQVDLGDFIDIVENNRAALDLEKLERLGNNVQPRGGGKILRLIEEIDDGKTIRL